MVGRRRTAKRETTGIYLPLHRTTVDERAEQYMHTHTGYAAEGSMSDERRHRHLPDYDGSRNKTQELRRARSTKKKERTYNIDA